MHIISRRHIGRAAIGTALVALLAVHAVAQATGGPDPATFDVAGVKLGMTPNDAIAALKKFDPKYAIAKQYYAQPQFTYGNTEGQDIKRLVGFNKGTGKYESIAYLYNLAAEKTDLKEQCVQAYHQTVCDKDPSPVDTVTVWLSPVPGQERVIAVQRKATFDKEPHPAIVSLKNGVFAKYPKDQATFEHQDASGYTVDWVFDAQKRIMSAAVAKRKSRYSANGRLPQNANPGDGIGLSVNFESNNQNAGLADSMSVILFDGNGLFRSIEQSQATYRALKAKADADEINKASKGQSQTKF
jgi:hypothetical protein